MPPHLHEGPRLRPRTRRAHQMDVEIELKNIFISLGILIGSLVSEKGTGGLGSIVVQLVCFTSGMYFPRESLGNVFGKICEYLPFESCLTILKGIVNNSPEIIQARNIIIFLIYTVTILIISVMVFKRKMISDNK